ncbi:FUSC family protein [Streptomyces sp. LP05-1]|uniref:FUSC family protein n=1 Tax=Streptomyces pyxinae TaxID=2970734 RepID=A0ABT2CNI7_9ACTN|nr:FUSC family protein [Streptomyces sp. LP05-1]MCS0639003.1 FUSC family protein [Streptomyces sp. LP05-1]
MSWLRALKATARSGLTVERRRLEPLVALRGAAGLALVVGVSLALFGPGVAASSAFGAFQAAIATFQRSWRPRATLALASGASLAVSTFLGYLTGAHVALFLALLLVWTFLAGLLWAAGTTAGIIASSNVAIMLVTVTLPTSVADAAAHAGMIAVGGLVQAALIVLVPIRRWGAQRDALADALAAEADYARRLRHDPYAPFDPVPLMTARNAAAVSPRQARHRPAELHGARGLAERIRPVLASLADPSVGVPAEGPERDRVRELLAAAAQVLDSAARAVRKGVPATIPPGALAALRTPDTAALFSGPPRRAAARLASLLEDVVETAGPTDRADIGDLRERPPLLSLLPGVLRTVRRELRADSPVLRHAVRVSAVAGVGYLIGAALPLGHGYWAPMAAVMSMRPDFTQTYARSVARFFGTLLGVALATGIVRLVTPETYASAVLAVVCAFGMYLLMRTGYAAGQIFVAAYVVFLLGMGGEQWTQTVPERVVLTLLGGVLAMAAYAVYPAWETPRLRTRLADWLAADGRYAAQVVAHYADPAASGATAAVRESLLATRDARVAWQDALERAAHEPVRHRGLSRAAAGDAEHALAQFGRVAMLMEAHLPDRRATPLPAAAALSEELAHATRQGAREVRERRAPRWENLRELVAGPPWTTAPGEEAGTSDGGEGTPAGTPGEAGAAETPDGGGAGKAGTSAGSDAGAAAGAGRVDDPVVRNGARMLLEALDALTEALADGTGPGGRDRRDGKGTGAGRREAG